MYISSLFIKNFRSIKEANVNLGQGKNVIVGKNNSGKSNTVLALDVLFGEKFATYRKFDTNIFHTYKIDKNGTLVEEVADYFYVAATLQERDFDKEQISLLKKSVAFSQVIAVDQIAKKDTSSDETSINYQLLTGLDELSNREEIASITLVSKAGNPYSAKEKWFNPQDLVSFLESAISIKIFYCRTREDDNYGYGLIVQDESKKFWISHYINQKIRDSILTTAIIPAFRNPKDELRLTGYNWYSKLIAYLWDSRKGDIDSQILSNTESIRSLADSVFQSATSDLQSIVKKAIAHESVSFKLINNRKEDLHKNLTIHIDDGIDRPLEQKGSGIQSAIIIALFTTYCTNFHNHSSILIAEEPELFLHPQARRLMSRQLEQYLDSSVNQKRQLIISTHSVEFIRNVDIDRIILVRKTRDTNQSSVSSIKDKTDLQNDEIHKITRFIWSKNAEIFFADKVLLVEGGEEYLIPAIFDSLTNEKQLLDYNNISIARVDGKGNFLTYIKILNKFSIPWVMLGDLDCYEDVLPTILDDLKLDRNEYDDFKAIITKDVNYKKLNKEVVKNPESLDGKKLKDLFIALKKNSISIDDNNLQAFIAYLESRFTKSTTDEVIESDVSVKEKFLGLQKYLRENGIFVLSKGAIESYYTSKAFSIRVNGKDNRALEISNCLNQKEKLEDYINNLDDFNELLDHLVPVHSRTIIESKIDEELSIDEEIDEIISMNSDLGIDEIQI